MDSDFEAMLAARNVPENMRARMRLLSEHVKEDLIRKDRCESPSKSPSKLSAFISASPTKSPSKRPLSIISGFNTSWKPPTEQSPEKKTHKRTRSTVDTDEPRKTHKRTLSSIRDWRKKLDKVKHVDGEHIQTSPAKAIIPTVNTDPVEFVRYFKTAPTEFDVGRLHKLRLVLRNERVSWVDEFLSLGGMTAVIDLLYQIMKIEWRDEHDDALLHEALLCLKALCTTDAALRTLAAAEETLFPALLHMLFDTEKRGPSEFSTRGIIMQLLFTYLSIDPTPDRARRLLLRLEDPNLVEQKDRHDFVSSMHHRRPFRVWAREVNHTIRDVFWIFLHNNVITGSETTANNYTERHFPRERPPVPAAPYVGGVEWEATMYLATHLDVMNGCIAALPDAASRNQLRTELRDSGFEQLMGTSLRRCKEKFYAAVHDGLRTWIAAADEDGWSTEFVSKGPAPKRSPVKVDNPPKIETGLELPELKLMATRSNLDWAF